MGLLLLLDDGLRGVVEALLDGATDLDYFAVFYHIFGQFVQELLL